MMLKAENQPLAVISTTEEEISPRSELKLKVKIKNIPAGIFVKVKTDSIESETIISQVGAK